GATSALQQPLSHLQEVPMSRKHMLAVAAGIGLAFCLTAPALAAPFNVYYRPGASRPWTFYAGKADKAAADATAAQLKELGYHAEVIVDGHAPPATLIQPA